MATMKFCYIKKKLHTLITHSIWEMRNLVLYVSYEKMGGSPKNNGKKKFPFIDWVSPSHHTSIKSIVVTLES